jgi:hypothetical protein
MMTSVSPRAMIAFSIRSALASERFVPVRNDSAIDEPIRKVAISRKTSSVSHWSSFDLMCASSPAAAPAAAGA